MMAKFEEDYERVEEWLKTQTCITCGRQGPMVAGADLTNLFTPCVMADLASPFVYCATCVCGKMRGVNGGESPTWRVLPASKIGT